jgi:hypothetical protein
MKNSNPPVACIGNLRVLKKTILTLLFLYIYIGLNAQTKITGFGKLKLGSPITIISEMGYSVESISTNQDYYKKIWKSKYSGTSATKIYEFIADSTQDSQITSSSLDPRVRVFWISNYSVTDGIEIKAVKLKFFNEKLIDIYCDGNEKLDEALTIKYGDPQKDVKEEEKKFTYTYTGNTVTKIDRTFTSKWETNDKNITCVGVLMKWYNNEGEENYLTYVQLSDNSYNEEINKVETTIKERIKNKKQLIKKQSLDGF